MSTTPVGSSVRIRFYHHHQVALGLLKRQKPHSSCSLSHFRPHPVYKHTRGQLDGGQGALKSCQHSTHDFSLALHIQETNHAISGSTEHCILHLPKDTRCTFSPLRVSESSWRVCHPGGWSGVEGACLVMRETRQSRWIKGVSKISWAQNEAKHKAVGKVATPTAPQKSQEKLFAIASRSRNQKVVLRFLVLLSTPPIGFRSTVAFSSYFCK